MAIYASFSAGDHKTWHQCRAVELVHCNLSLSDTGSGGGGWFIDPKAGSRRSTCINMVDPKGKQGAKEKHTKGGAVTPLWTVSIEHNQACVRFTASGFQRAEFPSKLLYSHLKSPYGAHF